MYELAQHALTATRFSAWTLLLFSAGCLTVYLYQLCKFRFWDGDHFHRALAGFVLAEYSFAFHQAYWWANEHLSTVGRCANHDPRVYDAYVCAIQGAVKYFAVFVTPVFYTGMLLGALLFLPTFIVSVSRFSEKIATKIVSMFACFTWLLGWWLAT